MEKMKLEEKLADIRKRKEQCLANLQALNGAEQVIIELINESEMDVNEPNTDN